MDWNAIGGFATTVGLLLVAWELYEVKRATHAQAFFSAVERLQDEALRRDRNTVYGLVGRLPKDWSTDEQAAAERVCHSYDVIGIMVRSGMLPKQIIVDSWGASLRDAWPILEPLVMQYRRERDDDWFWDDFPWLTHQANALHDKRKSRNQHRRA